jgi:hypothetical protein
MLKKIPRKRGRPAKKVFINVEILAKTRDALAEFKKITGLDSQGEVLDYMVADVLRRRPLTSRDS